MNKLNELTSSTNLLIQVIKDYINTNENNDSEHTNIDNIKNKLLSDSEDYINIDKPKINYHQNQNLHHDHCKIKNHVVCRASHVVQGLETLIVQTGLVHHLSSIISHQSQMQSSTYHQHRPDFESM